MPWSAQIHTTFHVCRITQGLPRASSDFDHGGFTLSAAAFHLLDLSSLIPCRGPTTPETKSPVWAIPVSLATTRGIDSLSFPPVTEMFHFTGYRVSFPNFHSCNRINDCRAASEKNDGALTPSGYPIRKSPDQSVFATTRSLSQLITSFIAC